MTLSRHSMPVATGSSPVGLVNHAYPAAVRYRLSGLQVIPIRADGSKAPALNSWKEYQDPAQPSDLSVFEGHVGIGIVCGRASGNLEVIDFDDPSTFAPWCAAVEDLCPGLVQRLLVVHTPRCVDGVRGVHVYSRHSNTPQGARKLARYANGNVRIETRGEGNYVVGPGSPPACHPSNNTWDLVAGDLSEIPTVTTAEREAMFQAAHAFDLVPDAVVGDLKPVTHNGDLSPGDDFDAQTGWADILTPHGWSAVGADRWRRPSKKSGWSASSHCTSTHGHNLLRVFSENAAPLEAKSYTKFAAYSILNHAGDFSAAARKLANQGYGTPRRSPDTDKPPYEAHAEAQTPREPVRINGASVVATWLNQLRSGDPPRRFTPFTEDNQALRFLDLRPGTVLLIGAPPGAGKTALSLQAVVDCLRTDATLKALVVNVEMPTAMMLSRQLARLAEYSMKSIDEKQIDWDNAGIQRAVQELEAVGSRIHWMEPPYALDRIVTTAKDVQVDLVLLDYVQRLEGRHADIRSNVNAAMNAARMIADNGAAVIVISALSRGKNGRGESSYDGNAGMAAFRESGELEYGCDEAYLMNMDDSDGTVMLRHAKARNRERANRDLVFDGKCQRFAEHLGTEWTR